MALRRRHLPRSRLRTLLLFLLLGAILNVAVAWFAVVVSGQSCFRNELLRMMTFTPTALNDSWSGNQETGKESLQSANEDRVELHRHWGFAVETIRHREIQHSVAEMSGDVVVRRSSHPVELEITKRIIAGWPALTLACENTVDTLKGGIPTPWQYQGLIASEIRLPLMPIWPGFAINTVFYAGVCWLLVAAPFAVRRRRRIKRGLCPACAYPVGTSAVCTECGRTVMPHVPTLVRTKRVEP